MRKGRLLRRAPFSFLAICAKLSKWKMITAEKFPAANVANGGIISLEPVLSVVFPVVTVASESMPRRDKIFT